MHGILRRGVHKEHEQEPSAGDVEYDDRKGQKPDHFDTGPETLRDAGQFSGSQVLSGVVGNTVPQRRKGGDHQIVELDCSRITGHDARSEAVDHALQDDIADRNKALLQDTGNGDLCDFYADGRGENPAAFFSPDGPEFFHHNEQCEESADTLAYEGRPGYTGDTHVKACHEPDIHGDVGTG